MANRSILDDVARLSRRFSISFSAFEIFVVELMFVLPK